MFDIKIIKDYREHWYMNLTKRLEKPTVEIVIMELPFLDMGLESNLFDSIVPPQYNKEEVVGYNHMNYNGGYIV